MSSDCNVDLLDGRYRLCEPLAQGGTATVWRACDERLGRAVAVKIIASDREAHDVRSEAQALARLSHPHIANVYDYADDTSQAYLVVELVDGPSLSSVLSRRDLSWEVAVACGAQIASALAAAHARGLVHRDVKPGNIMLTRSGAKLIDFGISAIAGAREAHPSGELRGTPAYVAPERLHNKAVSPAGDIYSLGVVLFRALSGELPTAAKDAKLPAGIPDPVAAICVRCLAKNPDDRPSAAELSDVLTAAAPVDATTELAEFGTVTDAQAVPTHVVPPLIPTEALSHTLWRPRFQSLLRQPLWSQSSSRSRGRLAAITASVVMLGLLAWSAVAPNGAPTSAATPQGPACDVTYQLQSDTGGQFLAAITASNRDEPVPAGWRLSMRVPAGAFVAGEGWQNDGAFVTSPAQPALEPGTSAQLSLTGAHGGAVALPTVFQLNGGQCDATLLGPPSPPAVAPPVGKPAVQYGTSKASAGDDGKEGGPKRRDHGGKKGNG
jgi:eukaryotic-like serine/threonine-protein kinase